VCDACLKSFRELPGEICERCGQPWAEGADVDGDESVCRECRELADSRLTLRGVSGFMTGGAGPGDRADEVRED